MLYNDSFRKIIIEKFKVDIKKSYLPDQTYINRLIASLSKVGTSSYSQYHVGFISEYEYLESVGALPSIKAFVDGCLYQLIWINTILESGKYVRTVEDLEEEFEYETPTMLGDPWTLDKVTKKGVFFRGDEPVQDSRIIINSDNIVEIALALYNVEHQYSDYIAANKYKQAKSVATSGSKASESSLFKSKDLEIKCLNVLKEIKHPILDVEGNFLNVTGMKGAIVLWYDKCDSLGFISKEIPINRDELAKKIEYLIPNLSIDGSSFDKVLKAKKYVNDIEQKLMLISKK